MRESKQKPSKYTGLKNIGDAYKGYKEDYPNTEMTKADYSNICYAFIKEAVNYVIEEAGEVRLPCGMGILRVIKKKRDLRSLQPDWKATKDLWARDDKSKEEKKLVYHLNDHTNGYYYRMYWRKGRVSNISVYSFVPVRAVKRSIAAAVSRGQDYLE